MKKKLSLLIIILCLQQLGHAQLPTSVPQTFGWDYYQFKNYVEVGKGLLLPTRNTSWTPKGPAIQYYHRYLWYYDTTANAWQQLAKFTDLPSPYTFPYSVVAPGNAIQLENDTTANPANYFYGRNSAGRRGWYPQSGIVGVNLFNSNGTLTGDREVDGGENFLAFSNLTGFGSYAQGNSFISGLGAIESGLYILKDTIKLNPYKGNLKIDSLNYTLSTTRKKILVRDTATGLVENIDPALIGGGSGTVTSVATNNGTGITGGTITGSGTLAIDTANTIATRLQLQHRIDSLAGNKQATLVSGTNIKTINGNSLLGSGDLSISGGSGATLLPQDSIYNANDFASTSPFVNTNIWEQKNAAVFPLYRDGATVINYYDTLFFFGGWHTTGPTVYDSVYWSIDGGVTKTYRGLMPWGAMHSFALFSDEQGYWYKIGGDYLSTEAQKKEVWRTRTPGVMASWVNVGTLPSRSRILFDAISLNNVLYTGGGQYTVNWSDGATDTIWKSTDRGENWTYHSSGTGYFDKNISHTWEKFQGRVYQVAGGQYDEGTPGNRTFDQTVYSSADMTNWRVENSIPTAGVSYPSVKAYDGKLWCIAGYNGSANVNTTIFMDKGGTWHVAANYDSTNTAMSITHAASPAVWRDRLVMYSGNDYNKVYWLKRSAYITSEKHIVFKTALDADSINTSFQTGSLSIGSKYSGTQTELIKINGINNTMTFQKPVTLNATANIVGSTAAAYSYLNFRNSNDALGYFQYVNSGWEFWHNNVLYQKFLSSGAVSLKNISAPSTPASGYGSLYSKTSDKKLYWKDDAGTEYDLTGSGGSSGITVGTTTITSGTSTNIPYNSSGTYQESSNLQWDNTNQLIQTGRGFRVKSGYTFLTEIAGSLSAILGSSVKRSATNGEVEKTSSDPGSYVRLNYQDGITFNTNFTGAASTSVAETNNEVMRINLAGNVGIGTASPSASAKVEISSTTKGFLPPRMTGTQAEAIASPAEGLMVYSTDGSGSTITSKGWWGYDGSAWVKLN